MGYLGINNLYKDQDILLFRRCFAMEKIHGSSSHITYNKGRVQFSSGGSKHNNFIKLFDEEKLTVLFRNIIGDNKAVIYGEAYGGSLQKMSQTYGPDLKFIAFDVQIGDVWLNVPNAHDVATKLGLEFVHYVDIPTDLEAIDTERDAESIQAIRNGVGPGKMREGIILRPPIEVIKNNGERIITKYKRKEFKEREHMPKVNDPEKIKVLTEAADIANEWVLPMRLEHILQDLPNATGIEHTGDVVKAMVRDVYKEAAGEIIESREVACAIGKKAAALWKQYLKARGLFD